jgi:hypothetical protein
VGLLVLLVLDLALGGDALLVRRAPAAVEVAQLGVTIVHRVDDLLHPVAPGILDGGVGVVVFLRLGPAADEFVGLLVGLPFFRLGGGVEGVRLRNPVGILHGRQLAALALGQVEG